MDATIIPDEGLEMSKLMYKKIVSFSCLNFSTHLIFHPCSHEKAPIPVIDFSLGFLCILNRFLPINLHSSRGTTVTALPQSNNIANQGGLGATRIDQWGFDVLSRDNKRTQR